MKKLLFLSALLCCSMMSNAKDVVTERTSYQLGDTVFFYQQNQTAKAKKAKKKKVESYGIVKHLDEKTNVATIQVFDAKDNTLIAIHKRIASGEDFDKREGRQSYFYPDGKLKKVDVYSLIHDEKSGENISVRASETLLYPNGKEQEKVTFKYIQGQKHETFDRKGYDPEGILRFHELGVDGSSSVTFFDEAGNIVRTMPDGYASYMTMPDFPGGQRELFKYLSQTVQYPKDCQRYGIQGKVVCSFVVAKNGKIEDVEVLKSGGHPLLDREAVRVIRSMPQWIPGTKRGEPVRVRYTLPISFKLQ